MNVSMVFDALSKCFSFYLAWLNLTGFKIAKVYDNANWNSMIIRMKDSILTFSQLES